MAHVGDDAAADVAADGTAGDAINDARDDAGDDAGLADADAPACLDPGRACIGAASCCSGRCSASLGVCLAGRCGAPGASCTGASDCCSASCVGGACEDAHVGTLDDARDRLLESFAARQGKADRCAAWGALDDIQKGIFLTHTDLLGNRSCMENASITSSTIGASGNCGGSDACRCPVGTPMALDHALVLWAIQGSDPGCSCTETSTGYNCCNGGADWHRIFFTADDRLIDRLRNVNGGLPEWGASTDLGGPHAPFTQSDETTSGQPRGQVHFWTKDADATTLTRVGVNGVDEPHMVELDNDYNLLHDSNPEGCYGFFGLGCSYGRVSYKKLWSDRGNQATTTFRGNGEPSSIAELASDAIWSPRCPTAHVDAVTAVTGAPPTPLARGAVLLFAGSGFEDCAAHVGCGNEVHVRTRAREVVIGAGSPLLLAEGASAIRVQLPEESGTGQAWAWVVVSSVASNLVPITIAK